MSCHDSRTLPWVYKLYDRAVVRWGVILFDRGMNWFDLGVMFSLLFIGDLETKRRIDGHDWYDMLFGLFSNTVLAMSLPVRSPSRLMVKTALPNDGPNVWGPHHMIETYLCDIDTMNSNKNIVNTVAIGHLGQ